MAVLQSIRNRAGVVIAVVIGVALFAFVLSDMMRSGKSLTRESDLEIAEVSGKSIDYHQYMAKVDEIAEIQKQNSGKTSLDENTVEMIREQTWDLIIKQMVMEDEYNELGLAVTPDELKDMTFGRNIHPQVKQLFTDPNTGIFDTARVVHFLKNMEQDQTGKQKAYWLFVEDALMRDRMVTKYNNLIKKGLYITTEQARREADEKNFKFNFKFVAQNYSAVSDSAVKVSDADINDYYNKNKSKYEQDASRDIEYVTFEVNPSEDDMKAAGDAINRLKTDFESAEDDKQFVNLNSDVPFNETYFTKGKMAPVLDSALFDAKIGTIYGPYLENKTYMISKLLQIKNLPDSVKASHILISIDQDTDSAKAQATADSLKKLIEKKADFAELAKKFSKDPGSGQKGGDLGWFKHGMMVKPFNDACFNGKKGELVIVTSQFGVHLIKIVDKSKEAKNVMVATIERLIKPSSRTYQNAYTLSSRFSGDNNTKEKFDKAVTEKGMNKKIANNIRENDKRVAGLENPRELVRWAYQSNKGDVSKAFEFGNVFVVAKLAEVREKGTAPVEQKKEEIEIIVRRDKKAEMLIQKLENQIKAEKTIDGLAAKLNTTVGTAENISFSSFSIPGAGIEPVVIATVTAMPVNKLSGPLKGNNGVYAVSVDNKTEAKDADFSVEQKNMLNSIQSQVDYKAYEALKKLANIKDMRSKFF
ncbi:MAG: peptidylprolyl isomerase [Bacteroidia bacterium]|nr:peptidylprolyl isomerase [Bacteroidia bacterium]